jgi:hypothetical protein
MLEEHADDLDPRGALGRERRPRIRADGPAATYLDMFRHNVETLIRPLSS